MKDFILNNLPIIIVIAVILVVAVIFWFVGKGKYRSKVKQMLLSLVIEAEEKYGGGTGEIKFSYVAQKIYDIMPSWLQLFFSAETIAGWIEDAVTAMKEYLSNNEEAATKINYTEKKKLVD